MRDWRHCQSERKCWKCCVRGLEWCGAACGARVRPCGGSPRSTSCRALHSWAREVGGGGRGWGAPGGYWRAGPAQETGAGLSPPPGLRLTWCPSSLDLPPPHCRHWYVCHRQTVRLSLSDREERDQLYRRSWRQNNLFCTRQRNVWMWASWQICSPRAPRSGDRKIWPVRWSVRTV